jgi:hypothetical protein
MVGMKPGSATKMLISWVPGDNNDSVEFEVSTTKFSDKHNDPMMDLQVTWGDVITCEYEMMPILYLQYHYVTIWGRRKGRYSKTALYYRFLMPLTGILPYLKMWVTPQQVPYVNSSGVAQGSGGSGWINGKTGSCAFGLPTRYGQPESCGGAGLEALTLDGSYIESDAWWWTTCDVVALNQVSGNAHYGEVIYAQYPRDYGLTRYIDFSPWLLPCDHFGGSVYMYFIDAPDRTVWMYNNWTCWWGPWDTPTVDDSFWLPASCGVTPRGYTLGSGVEVFGPLNGGFVWAQCTVFFHDGSSPDSNSIGWLAFRVSDPDHGIFEIWAHCSGAYLAGMWLLRGRKQAIYFGDIELCNNYGTDEGQDYHGFLPISLLDLT